MTISFKIKSTLDELLRDESKKPSFEWAETFATLIGNSIHVYTNNEFDVQDAELTYYRQPRHIQIQGCVDPYTGITSATEIESEFKVISIISEKLSSITSATDLCNIFLFDLRIVLYATSLVSICLNLY